MKQVYSIGNCEGWNASQLVLLIEVGDAHCCFGIVDYASSRMLEYCCYASDADESGDMLQAIADERPELGRSFRQTVVGYYTNENVLFPSRFYRYEEAQNVLQSLFEKGANVVVSESVPEWQLYNVYFVPSAVHAMLSRKFATGHFWHVYSIVLKNKFVQNEGGNLFLDFKTNSFSVVAVKDHALLLGQIYPYTNPADVLYWLLKTCQEFSLLQAEIKLNVSGLIDKQSALCRDLYQYFLDIEFATLENKIQLSTDFARYPVHYFSSLYKLATCVS